MWHRSNHCHKNRPIRAGAFFPPSYILFFTQRCCLCWVKCILLGANTSWSFKKNQKKHYHRPSVFFWGAHPPRSFFKKNIVKFRLRCCKFCLLLMATNSLFLESFENAVSCVLHVILALFFWLLVRVHSFFTVSRLFVTRSPQGQIEKWQTSQQCK